MLQSYRPTISGPGLALTFIIISLTGMFNVADCTANCMQTWFLLVCGFCLSVGHISIVIPIWSLHMKSPCLWRCNDQMMTCHSSLLFMTPGSASVLRPVPRQMLSRKVSCGLPGGFRPGEGTNSMRLLAAISRCHNKQIVLTEWRDSREEKAWWK